MTPTLSKRVFLLDFWHRFRQLAYMPGDASLKRARLPPPWQKFDKGPMNLIVTLLPGSIWPRNAYLALAKAKVPLLNTLPLKMPTRFVRMFFDHIRIKENFLTLLDFVPE
jgi:hypothetical protein